MGFPHGWNGCAIFDKIYLDKLGHHVPQFKENFPGKNGSNHSSNDKEMLWINIKHMSEQKSQGLQWVLRKLKSMLKT